MTRTLYLSLALITLAGCTRDNPAPRRRPPPPPPALVPPAVRTPPPPGVEDVDAAVPAVPEPVDAGVARAAPFDPDASVLPGSPHTFEGPGISVVIRDDRMVEIHTTDNWDASVDQTFETCEYARNAVPTLRRSMSPEAIAVIVRACGAPHSGAGNRGGAHPAGRPGARPAR